MPISRPSAIRSDVEELMRQHMESISQRQLNRVREATSNSSASVSINSRTPRWTDIPPSYYTVDVNQFYEPTQETLQTRRQREREQLERLIETGVSDQAKYIDDSGTLFVFGYNIDPTNILFTIDSEAIIAHEERSKHLKPLLNKLAKREGLELRLIDALTDLPDGSREVIYYAFKHRGEVDDTELVAVAQPRFKGIQEEHNEEGCGDPGCGSCYGDEDEEDEEPWD